MLSVIKYFLTVYCKLTLSILYCHSSDFPCWSLGWGCHLTVKARWSAPGFKTFLPFVWICCEFAAISLAIALSSGWRAIASADSSKSMWVGEGARWTGAKARLSRLFSMNRVTSDENLRTSYRTMYFAFWIWCKGSAGGGVIERERLRCWRFRLPFCLPSGVDERSINSRSESESSDTVSESILQLRGNESGWCSTNHSSYRAILSFCHRGALESCFFLLFLLFGDVDVSLSLSLSILPVLGISGISKLKYVINGIYPFVELAFMYLGKPLPRFGCAIPIPHKHLVRVFDLGLPSSRKARRRLPRWRRRTCCRDRNSIDNLLGDRFGTRTRTRKRVRHSRFGQDIIRGKLDIFGRSIASHAFITGPIILSPQLVPSILVCFEGGLVLR